MSRSKKLAKKYRNKPCEICDSYNFCSGHHLISYGSNPKLDIEENIIGLCWTHHREIHDIGLSKFVEKYNLQLDLIERGFYYDEFSKKWRFPLDSDTIKE